MNNRRISASSVWKDKRTDKFVVLETVIRFFPETNWYIKYIDMKTYVQYETTQDEFLDKFSFVGNGVTNKVTVHCRQTVHYKYEMNIPEGIDVAKYITSQRLRDCDETTQVDPNEPDITYYEYPTFEGDDSEDI